MPGAVSVFFSYSSSQQATEYKAGDLQCGKKNNNQTTKLIRVGCLAEYRRTEQLQGLFYNYTTGMSCGSTSSFSRDVCVQTPHSEHFRETAKKSKSSKSLTGVVFNCYFFPQLRVWENVKGEKLVMRNVRSWFVFCFFYINLVNTQDRDCLCQ